MSGLLPLNERLNFTYRANHKNVQSLPFHSHELAEIYYFHQGKCTYFIGDQILHLQPGDLILMNGLTLHCPKLFRDQPYVRSTLHFDQAYFQRIFETMGYPTMLATFTQVKPLLLPFRGAEKEKVEAYLKRLNDRHPLRESDEFARFQLAFMDFISFLSSHSDKHGDRPSSYMSQKEKTVQAIVGFIEANYQEDLKLEAIEVALHMSKYHLAKVFKEMTGATIFKYLYQRRVNQAKIEFLLHQTSVTEVCYQVGFNYPSHFTKVFKQLTGLTPEQYKRQAIAE
ncbi:AraC family transcriptional regulator [Shouchella hunanensis]|uniref:AraC family transcriptional regulator n=1 Tax=Shouchella hunanensis TaxID=766894 RepID=A0ABY7WBC3_9BACI|nr:AraC family transcriptional regulator [Shouchella hunanensis]WDF04934.1 AraC family transcriptional regulator [Shouchella hunanensis]